MKKLYDDYIIKPYISPNRDLEKEDFIPVSKRNMNILEDNLLAGDIILLWRINFGNFTNRSWFPKYFEYIYGINAPYNLRKLVENSYVKVESSKESLKHINLKDKKAILKKENLKGYSRLKSKEIDKIIIEKIDLNILDNYFDIRGYKLSEKGRLALEKYHSIVDRHSKKNI